MLMKPEEVPTENTSWSKFYLFILFFNILLVVIFYLIRLYFNIS
jgi:hypothetical protein